jgi:hypothetical protein
MININADYEVRNPPKSGQDENALRQAVIEEASQESFPASDPPAWTGVTGASGCWQHSTGRKCWSPALSAPESAD